MRLVALATTFWLALAPAASAARKPDPEELPPSTLGLWIGIGLVVGMVLLVAGLPRLIRWLRTPREPEPPLEEPALAGVRLGAEGLFEEVRSAWNAHDEGWLRDLVSPAVLASWRPTVGRAAVGDAVSVDYLRSEPLSAGEEDRAVVRVRAPAGSPRELAALRRTTALGAPMPRRQRAALTAVACIVFVAAAVGIGLAPRSRTHSAPPATIVVRDGRPVGGVRTLVYREGATIDITVTSDTAGEIHFHGYDLHRDVARGGSARFHLKASATGEFEVEVEATGEKIADVCVTS